MNKIKFSHKYAKMPDTHNTRLIEVFKTNYNELHPGFRIYDTEYETGYYELPKEDLLVLLLYSVEENISGGFNEHLWTTIRRWTPEKEKYYRGIRGQQVEIVIEEIKS